MITEYERHRTLDDLERLRINARGLRESGIPFNAGVLAWRIEKSAADLARIVNALERELAK